MKTSNAIWNRVNPVGFVLPAVVIVLWYVWATRHPSLLLPPPQDTFIAIRKLWIDGKLQHYFITSMTRFSYGLLIGTVSGFFVGALLGRFVWLERLFLPNVHALRLIPIVGWIPVFTIWFGMGDMPRIVIIAMGAFFPMLLNTYAGFRSVSKRFIEVGKIFGLGTVALFWRIVLPSALPSIRSGTILSLTFSWTILVASEILSETNGGLSDILDIGKETFHLELVNAGILILGFLGFVFNAALVSVWNIGKLRWLSVNVHNRER
jgi:sulfonate transport system permease protein